MHRAANRLHEDGLLGNFLRVPEGRSDACPLRALFRIPEQDGGRDRTPLELCRSHRREADSRAGEGERRISIDYCVARDN